MPPQFECQVCGAAFDVPQGALDKYPGWSPKYCREHSPQKKTAQQQEATRTKPKGSGASRSGGGSRTVEENLTLDQVLQTYTDGPREGVFTDGSSIPNPGPGGWGMVWVVDGQVHAQKHGAADHTTNNRMELQALIEAYKTLPEDAAVIVHTDSRLCVDTITQWAPGWEKKGWTKKSGPIKNLELIQELLALYRKHPECPLQWIAAHSGNRWNEYADSLATAWNRAVL